MSKPPQVQDAAAVVALLEKHKGFSSAASYDLQCLASILAARDDVAQQVERLEQHQGIEAVLACLENAKAATASGSTLLQSATRVLCRCLAVRPQPVAALVQGRGGVGLVVRALRSGDDRPVDAIQFLGKMATAGHCQGIAAAQGVELLVHVLLKEEAQDVRRQATLALSQIAIASAPASCDTMLPEASRRAMLGEAILASLADPTEPDPSPTKPPGTCGSSSGSTDSPPASQQQQQQHFSASPSSSLSAAMELLQARVVVLLWLATTSSDEVGGALLHQMAEAGLGPRLLHKIHLYEEEPGVPAELLSLCGKLLFNILEGPLLDQALQSTAAASSSAALPSATPLAVVSAVSLCSDGRRVIMAASVPDSSTGDVLGSLLHLCTDGMDGGGCDLGVLKAALRTMERLASELGYANELLKRKALDAAMSVMNRAAGHGDSTGMPDDVVAAATSLVARLSEMMLLGSSNDSPSSVSPNRRHRRLSSSGMSETKMQALGCALAAYARHPGSLLLFRSVVDLAISSMRSSKTAPQAVDALWRLIESAEGALPRNHRVDILRKKLWAEKGLEASVTALQVAEEMAAAGTTIEAVGQGLRDTLCKLLVRVVPTSSSLQGHERRKSSDKMAFRVERSVGIEKLHQAVETMMGGPEKEKRQLLAFLRPIVETRKLQAVTTALDGLEVDAPRAGVQEAIVGEKKKETEEKEEEEERPPEKEVVVVASPALSLPPPVPSNTDIPDVPKVESFTESLSLSALPKAPAWVQVAQAPGRISFVNLETGAAQFELPSELADWWAQQHQRKQLHHQEEVVLCEIPRWTVKIHPYTNMVSFEARGDANEDAEQPSFRTYRLPADVPPGFLGVDKLQVKELQAQAAVAVDDDDDAAKRKQQEMEEAEREEQEARALLKELDQLHRDMEEHARLSGSQEPLPNLSHVYAGLLRRIKRRLRSSHARPSDSLLESGLCDALRKALERAEDTGDLLHYYKNLFDQEKAAHDRKGQIAGLEATMALVKGEVLQLTPEELPRISKVLLLIERGNPNPELEAERLLKEAHLLIKRIVIQIAGEQKSDTTWTLTLPALENIPVMYLSQLEQQLQVLVICYDNLTPQQKAGLTTASEIVKNRSWLISLAVRCAEYVKSMKARGGGSPPINPSTTLGGTLSSTRRLSGTQRSLSSSFSGATAAAPPPAPPSVLQTTPPPAPASVPAAPSPPPAKRTATPTRQSRRPSLEKPTAGGQHSRRPTLDRKPAVPTTHSRRPSLENHIQKAAAPKPRPSFNGSTKVASPPRPTSLHSKSVPALKKKGPAPK